MYKVLYLVFHMAKMYILVIIKKIYRTQSLYVKLYLIRWSAYVICFTYFVKECVDNKQIQNI